MGIHLQIIRIQNEFIAAGRRPAVKRLTEKSVVTTAKLTCKHLKGKKEVH